MIEGITKNKLDKTLFKLIRDWQFWLKNQKGVSKNTFDAYTRDIKYFLNFILVHKGEGTLTIKTINNLKTIDFRSWLSQLSYGPPKRKVIPRPIKTAI